MSDGKEEPLSGDRSVGRARIALLSFFIACAIYGGFLAARRFNPFAAEWTWYVLGLLPTIALGAPIFVSEKGRRRVIAIFVLLVVAAFVELADESLRRSSRSDSFEVTLLLGLTPLLGIGLTTLYLNGQVSLAALLSTIVLCLSLRSLSAVPETFLSASCFSRFGVWQDSEISYFFYWLLDYFALWIALPLWRMSLLSPRRGIAVAAGAACVAAWLVFPIWTRQVMPILAQRSIANGWPFYQRDAVSLLVVNGRPQDWDFLVGALEANSWTADEITELERHTGESLDWREYALDEIRRNAPHLIKARLIPRTLRAPTFRLASALAEDCARENEMQVAPILLAQLIAEFPAIPGRLVGHLEDDEYIPLAEFRIPQLAFLVAVDQVSLDIYQANAYWVTAPHSGPSRFSADVQAAMAQIFGVDRGPLVADWWADIASGLICRPAHIPHDIWREFIALHPQLQEIMTGNLYTRRRMIEMHNVWIEIGSPNMTALPQDELAEVMDRIFSVVNQRLEGETQSTPR